MDDTSTTLLKNLYTLWHVIERMDGEIARLDPTYANDPERAGLLRELEALIGTSEQLVNLDDEICQCGGCTTDTNTSVN